MMEQEGEGEEITPPQARRQRERDFVSLFNALWYRDFPTIRRHEDVGERALWTTHIASTVKQCADLLGFFTRFETGNRTDAVVQKPLSRKNWAKIEWEWKQPFRETVNELDKLASADGSADVFVFIGYSDIREMEKNLEKIDRIWKPVSTPLLVFLITYSVKQDRRAFQKLQTYRIAKGTRRRLREQHALPWQVPDSKWKAMAEEALESR
jgi:hypothetical protein